jgi:hypothetical protein
MTPTPCDACAKEPVFGSPSAARWRGPDGGAYCSMHLVSKFGHAEPLVKLGDYEAPKSSLPPAPKKPKQKKPKTVEA